MASKIRKFLDIQGLLKLIRLVKNNEQPHWIGTQAEYDSQKANIPNGAIVALTDEEDTTYDHGKYATVETVTGQRWIDGKPIYRKVFVVPNTSSTAVWLRFNYDVPDLEEVVNWNGYSVAKSTATHAHCQRILGFDYYGGMGYIGGVTIYKAGHYLYPGTIGIFEGSDLAAETDHYVITLEYTKTTD